MLDNNTIQIVTTALAVLGAVLGVMNAWRNWVHDRVKVRVLVTGTKTTAGEPGLLITVRNLSRFAITIEHFGFDMNEVSPHLSISELLTIGRVTLPVRMESRTSFTHLHLVRAIPASNLQHVRFNYVETACGRAFRGGFWFYGGKHWAALAAEHPERMAKTAS